MMHPAMRLTLLLAIALSAIGCAALSGLATGSAPCADRFSTDRCEAMVDRVAHDLGVEHARIAGLDLLPEPTRDPTQGATLGGPGFAIPVRVHFVDGSTQDMEIGCFSGLFEPECMDEPAVRPASVTTDGYRDVPCAGDGTTCATPHPEIDPAAAAAARPIFIERELVPIDRVGRYEVVIGSGSLPNGILTEASFRLDDPWPDGIGIVGGLVLLDVRSVEPDGRPFDNYYLHGWREGVERVEVVLEFDVGRFAPGGVLSIADVVVR